MNLSYASACQVLASAGIASYKKCLSVVLGGHVTVNGIPELHPQRMIDTGQDKVLVKGRLIEPVHEHQYILINKPAGVMSTMNPASKAGTSLVQLLNPTMRSQGPHVDGLMHMVWRLGILSSGLQLITTDMHWANEVRSAQGMFRQT